MTTIVQWREAQSSWLPSLLGLVMLVGGCGILFWNEGRAVRTSLSLEEGLREVTVPETTAVVFEENNGKLVLVSGPLDVPDPLTDSFYSIRVHAAKLRKVVQARLSCIGSTTEVMAVLHYNSTD